MGFSIAASHIIFFIAVVAISAGVVGVFGNYIDQAQGAMTDKQNRITDQLKTDVKIVNVYYDSSTSPDTLDVFVKNIGTKTLDVECIDLYIDDTYTVLESNDFTDPETSSITTIWNRESTIQIDAQQNLDSGIHEIRLVTCNGVTSSYDFST